MEKLSKIVSTPNATSWSQAYNAGKLFAVLSLDLKTDSEGELETQLDLNILGKDLLENLESEFFSLENKDLDGIKQAVLKTSEKVPNNIKASLVVAVESTNILYLVIKGEGKVDLKREGNLGSILAGDDENGLKSASGFLQNDDCLILQTSQFSELVPSETLAQSLDDKSTDEIAEILAPIVHKSEKGGAASIILKYKDETPPPPSEVPIQPQEEKGEARLNLRIINDYFYEVKNLIKNRSLQAANLPHSKRVILTVGLILIIVFVGSIFLAVKRQNDKKAKELYAQVYVQASKKYEEGQSLVDLNQALARDSFQGAKKILEDNIEKFPKDSKEGKEANELLSKVNQALTVSSGVVAVRPAEVNKDESKLLSFELDREDGLYFAKDDKNLYFISKTSVSSDKKTLIKNDGDWKEVGGLGTFFGNIYVLDKTSSQILKFVATPSEFGRANYFTKSKPDLKNAKAMAIDGSIWILFEDGSVRKYTKGEAENFSISGLDKPLSNPTRIFTDSQTNNLYVLDNGSSRIVVFGKDGRYQSQYVASILKDAKDFDVQESSKKIFVLVGSKIYRIELQ